MQTIAQGRSLSDQHLKINLKTFARADLGTGKYETEGIAFRSVPEMEPALKQAARVKCATGHAQRRSC